MKEAMEKGKVTLSISPMRWMGMRGWLGDDAMALFKGCAYIRAWDPDGKTWYFPENFEPLVRSALGLPVTGAPNIRLEPRPTDGDLEARIKAARRTGVVFSSRPMEPHWLDDDPYKILMIDENAPQGLVDSAYHFWRWNFGRAGGPPEPLERVEAAYKEIFEHRLAYDEAGKLFDRGGK